MDASALIGILGELGRPDLIDSMLEPGHAPAVAGRVKPGLRRRKTGEWVEFMVRRGKTRVFPGSTPAELRRIRKAFPGLGPGECDTLLLHGRVHSQDRSYCTLDEKRARSAARRLGIPFMGLLVLLVLLKERGIVDGREAGEIAEDLRRAGFWMPADLAIWPAT